MHDAPFWSVPAMFIEGRDYYNCMLNLIELAMVTISDAEEILSLFGSYAFQ